MRRKNDPTYKLRRAVSKTVYICLKKNHSSKNKNSVLQYLPYTPQELKQHLEAQFEPWMNWKNWGPLNYNKKTWQIDHIIPQAILPYNSMDHPNFQKCWALENLRPLEAFANLKKADNYDPKT